MIAATVGLGMAATVPNEDCSGAGAADHVRVRHGLHLLDVGAGGEHALPAVDDHRTDVVPLARLERRRPDLLLHGGVERVHLRPVEPDGPDPAVHLEPDELAHLASSGRCSLRPARYLAALPPGPPHATRHRLRLVHSPPLHGLGLVARVEPLNRGPASSSTRVRQRNLCK